MEKIVLVDEYDNEIGVEEKTKVHQLGLLHRAFSVFIFNDKNEMLLQQRAFNKYHSGGLWTNACCSHPHKNETVVNAAKRRLQEELGFITELQIAFHFIYKADFENGLIEHEYDYVLIGFYNQKITPNINEVTNYKFVSWIEIENELQQKPKQFTAWFKIALPMVKSFMMK